MTRWKGNKAEQGFTIVELVVVIALLGILAAVALPRFLNVNDDARKAVMDHLEGKMHTVAATVYAQAVVAGVHNDSRNDADVVIDGLIAELKYGYPEARVSTAGHADIVDLLDLNLSGGLAVDDSANNSVRIGYDTNNNGCYLQYTEADASASAPNPYSVVRVNTGCN